MQNTATTQTRQKQTSRVLPVGIRVANAMHQLGVVGLPRNYEVFYGALNNTNTELRDAFFDAGTDLNQSILDDLYSQFCTKADDDVFVSKICDELRDQLIKTIDTIRKDKASKTEYSTILSKVSKRLSPLEKLNKDTIDRIVNVLSEATQTAQSKNNESLSSIKNTSDDISNLKLELEEYKKLADTDPLTGLLNRRAFDHMMAELVSGKIRNTGILIGDIDHFKAINDTYGHPFGDMVIKTVGDIARANVRDNTVIARIGGEEFALVSPNIDATGIKRLGERIRVAVAEHSFQKENIKLPPGNITISFGACHSDSLSDKDDLYYSADEALYSSKRNGRNTVTIFGVDGNSLKRKDIFVYRD